MLGIGSGLRCSLICSRPPPMPSLQELRVEYRKGDAVESMAIERIDDSTSLAGSFKDTTTGTNQQVSDALSALATKVASSLEQVGGQLMELKKTCSTQISAVESDLNGIRASQEKLASELSSQMTKLDDLIAVLTKQQKSVA